jgi:NAD(P) transhydrogenase subunit beta
MFIIGLHMLRGPRTAVRGNQIAAVGMAIAVSRRCCTEDRRLGLIVLGVRSAPPSGCPRRAA